MIHSLRPYIGVIHQQLLNSLAKLLAFRTSFALTILVEIASFLTFYTTITFIFLHVERIGPWSRETFLFFAFFVQILLCLHTTFASGNFWNFGSELRTGNLDFRLLRPLGTIFDTLTAVLRPAALIVLPFHVACLCYYAVTIHLPLISWFLLVPTLALSLTLMFLIELTIAMAMFWTTQGDGINFLRMQCQQIQRWPDFMYSNAARRTFTYYLPVLVTGSFSVRFLLDPSRYTEMFFVLAAIIVFWLAVTVLWKAGLRRYESASS